MAFPSAEIDHLAVTSFVIQTRNWSGSIAPGAHRDELVPTGASGVSELGRASLAQNRSKVAFLHEKLPRLWPIDSIGVFAPRECSLHRDLPYALVHISKLGQSMRQRRRGLAAF